VRAGDLTTLGVTVISTHETAADLVLHVDGRPVLEERVSLVAGAQTLDIRYDETTIGWHALTVEVRPAGASSVGPAGRAETFVVVKDRPRVLLIQQRAGEADALHSLLTQGGLRVDVRDPTAIPASVGGLSDYDAVVLDNVSATALALDQQKTLQVFVRDLEGGLVVVGGQASFTLGAYSGSILEQALPLLAEPPERREKGNLALVLVVDKSGSMDLSFRRVTKMQMAREGASQSVQVLRPDDILGVLTFNTGTQWVVSPQRLADAGLERVQARIAAIRAEGGTDIYKALEAAYVGVGKVEARFKHIILLTDGQSVKGDYDGLLQRNRDQNVTLSTVAVGRDADTNLLEHLAQAGNGRYYFTEQFSEIPQLVAKETSIATRAALAEGGFTPQLQDASPLLQGVVPSRLPALYGYVQTTARPRTTVALAADRGDPILAHWYYGLGRVAAWTPDVGGTWSGEWLGWPDATAFFANVVRWSMPAAVRADFRPDVEVVGRQVTLRLDSLRIAGTFADGLETRATVITPTQHALQVTLTPAAPGRYERRITVDRPGLYRLLLTQAREPGQLREELFGFVVDDSLEQRALGTNTPLLRTLAARTGGRTPREPVDVFSRDPSGAQETRWLAIWQWAVAGFVVLFVLDIAVRRLRLPRWRWVRPPVP
jgi:Mg-chelatase subunit ChlD